MKLLRAVGATLVLAVLTGIFTELALRAQEPFFQLMTRKFNWANRFVGHPLWHHWPRPNSRSTHAMVDPITYPRPYIYQTNSLGVRDDRELAIPKPAGITRILLLGDSYTEGYYAEDTVAVRMEQRLEELFPESRFEVINAGCSSYSPLLEFLRLKHQLIDLQPDQVIVNIDPSDVFDDPGKYGPEVILDARGEPIAAGGHVAWPRRLAEWIKDWSYLARCASWFWQTRNADREGADMTYVPYHSTLTPESERWQKDVAFSISYIRRLIEFCKRRNVPIAVATYPHRRHLEPNPGEALWHRGYERAIERLCREQQTPFYSAYEDVRRVYQEGTPIYWTGGDVHFTPVGQRVWSELMTNFYLRELGPR